MNYSKAWGHLGKPPKTIMDGSSAKLDLYRDYQDKMAKAAALTNSRTRAARMAEVRAQYLRDFPPEENT